MRRSSMKRRVVIRMLLLVALSAVGVRTGPAHAAMTDYCQVPPYVIQNTPPNVLILLDTSGSMLNFAYYDGYQTPNDPTDDLSCTENAPCSQYAAGRPAAGYYGYFDPNQWYTYLAADATFYPSPSGTRTGAYLWSGDFLNWLTMRRIDVMRKVLTGGRPSGNVLDTEIADDPQRGLFKDITSAEASQYTPYSQEIYFEFRTGNSGTSRFDVKRKSDKVLLASVQAKVAVPLPVEGVLQTVVRERARIGLMFYDTSDDGGRVITNVGKDVGGKSSLADTINQINLSRPGTNTPLAEALWSATGYFAQQASIAGYSSGSDGPRYGNLYGIGNNPDPMNFGSGGQSRWPVCQKNFVLLLTDGEPCSDGKISAELRGYGGLSSFNCDNVQSCPSRANSWTVNGTPAGYDFPGSSLVNLSCPGTGGLSTHGDESGVEDVALFMHTNDLRNFPVLGKDNISGFQNLTLYTVLAFGKDSTLLKYAAINGGFEPDNTALLPSTGPPSNWDKDNNGTPDTYYDAADGAELKRAVENAFSGILKRASSGTAASVLASGEGSGANLIQAVFYPRRRFGNDIVWWTGSLQSLWYFVDPFFKNATIREESTQPPPTSPILDLRADPVAQFFFDAATQLTQVLVTPDNDGDGAPDNVASTIKDFESLNSLWEAGRKLWERDLSSSARSIKTSLNGSTLYDFSVGNAATLASHLMLDPGDDAATIINYVHGIDNTNLRLRTAATGAATHVWKLGDVVNSTPRIVASVALNTYDSVYFDTTYKAFIDSPGYRNRGMVFTGGNDGMLHAFRLGKLELSWSPQEKLYEKAKISGTGFGDEAWAFIPKNALPYLKYLTDPDYCHLYYTDLSPYVFDASIGNGSGDQSAQLRTATSWRTVLIGGMRTGGACDNSAGCTMANNCVKTPGGGPTGFSSYFALDVTDPTTPTLLWEFTNPSLGFTTTGPAVVRINAVNTSTSQRDRALNGEWYVVFGSGPTGPIDNTNNQFLGRSNQNLRFFVLNLKTGEPVQTIDTTIPYAFAGSMINSAADFNLDYEDDALYVGYVKREGSSPLYTWTQGGVGRILTKNVTPNNGAGWVFSKVIDDIGPVTSSVSRLQNQTFSTNWLFFGTGRYFFENPPTGTNTTPEIDDATGQRRLFGLREPCFTVSNTINPNCTAPPVTFSPPDPLFPNVTDIDDVPSESTANSAAFKGWFIDLDASSTLGTTSTYFTYNNVTLPYRAERVITDPLSTTSGFVFFTTYKPYADECALGGKSFLWALRYNTGGAPNPAVLKGKALVQVSTASVEQIDLATAFTDKGGRRSGAIEGVPPTAQGLSLLSQPPPVKRILHMMER
jgi:type IV pilus assembly protein PilY1